MLRNGQTLISFCDPLGAPEALAQFAARGVAIFAMEMVPRITRAQSMDALSSMATLAGYKAALLAASSLPKMFPMMMTAAGTLLPARVLILGVGVAGLQAIATARRLGAVVEAYDVRPDVKDQVQSLGAKFLELPLEAAGAQDAGGYAKAFDESFYRRQRELLLGALARQDVVITTAAVPGRKAPLLIDAEMVAAMAPGSVIVDLAAERGGNCAVTRLNETVVHQGVTVIGPDNLPSTVPNHASQMYAKNVTSLLVHLVKEGKLRIDLDDEITRETLVARDGKAVHPKVREVLERGGGPQRLDCPLLCESDLFRAQAGAQFVMQPPGRPRTRRLAEHRFFARNAPPGRAAREPANAGRTIRLAHRLADHPGDALSSDHAGRFRPVRHGHARGALVADVHLVGNEHRHGAIA